MPGIVKLFGITRSFFILTNTSQAYAFGFGQRGQLGIGSTDPTLTPTLVANLASNVIDIVATNDNSFFLTKSGTAFGTGYGPWVGVGGNGGFNALVPLPISLTNITKITGGFSHAVFLTISNQAWVTGYGFQGQLGLNDSSDQQNFVLAPLINVTHVAAGFYQSFFFTSSGQVFGCGRNDYGQLGVGLFGIPRVYVPTLVIFTPAVIGNVTANISAIATGLDHTLFLANNGQVYVAGGNNVKSVILLMQLVLPARYARSISTFSHCYVESIVEQCYSNISWSGTYLYGYPVGSCTIRRTKLPRTAWTR
jgi:alpha-tubulin suppressor-like RCC1 family protein